jgi:uncharacterized protein
MRDLTSRLRDIVRRETTKAPLAPSSMPPVSSSSMPLRELTYIPDVEASEPRGQIADALGGRNVDDAGACVMVERRYDGSQSHGRRRIDACVPVESQPMHLFDPRVAAVSGWSRRPVFFDIETTGLSGGAGTVAFLVGCGWFEDDSFVVRQFLLVGPSGEKPLLSALAETFADASLLVTFNGRTFDVPFMETRWAFHRAAPPTDDLLHFDVLPPARRLWSRRGLTLAESAPVLESESEGCSLTALERRVLGFHRHGDVPGFEIPARYFHFLRTGDASSIEGVLDHNRHDIVSLAVVMSHALWLAQEGPDACREPLEHAALGRIYERAGDVESAVRAFEMAASGDDAAVAAHALWNAGVLLRRHKRHAEAAHAWQRIVDLPSRERRRLGHMVRRAVEALAIHHEHRAHDLEAARRFADELKDSVTGRDCEDVERRLGRLDRKLARRDGTGLQPLGYDE